MELNHKVFGDIGEDVIILHGLLGSLDNWQTIAKKLSETYRVWILDLRNHGRSFHSDEMSYDVMSEDLLEFMSVHSISSAHLMGHSMGGKVAMTFSLKYPHLVDQLIVVDIGPKPYEGDHMPILDAMISIRTSDFSQRGEIEFLLSEKIHSQSIVQLMLKNLGRDSNGFYWKPNVTILKKVYRNLMDSRLPDIEYNGITTFIKGGESNYIEVEELDSFRKYFPQSQIIVIPGAGHWVHADQPERFLQIVERILDRN